jgi:hypothetical protein
MAMMRRGMVIAKLSDKVMYFVIVTNSEYYDLVHDHDRNRDH